MIKRLIMDEKSKNFSFLNKPIASVSYDMFYVWSQISRYYKYIYYLVA